MDARKVDHPRLRGEKGCFKSLTVAVWGSPPPTRGKAVRCRSPCDCPRITPAYAGKRLVAIVVTAYPKDHPRLRGEKLGGHLLVAMCLGSPPPTRGKGSRRPDHHPEIWITPAYAGKSGYEPVRRQLRQDHPRLRGEKVAGVLPELVCQGSPPPTRGKD